LGRWYYETRLSIYLYDRSQNHGDHNLSHFHVKCKNGDKAVFDTKGNKIEGNTKYDKEISKLIKRNQKNIIKCLIKLSEGKDINEVQDKL